MARLSDRERAIVALSGVVADLDGLGAVFEIGTRASERPLPWFSDYHHVLGHNLGAALVVIALAFCLARRRLLVATLSGIAFHLHLLGDVLGGRGPDGYAWPIPYLLPFSNAWQIAWGGQWALNAWPNFAITGVALWLTFHVAWKRGCSPLAIVSSRANAAFVETLRKRLGHPIPADQGSS
jgi:inner membrane protein